MILVLDNYDSFVHNLARYLRVLGWPTAVVRNDRVSLREIEELAPSHIVVSPGPCTPDEAGLSVEAIRHFSGRLPILGVCLGHQCIGQAFGARIERARKPLHGKASRIHHASSGLFAGLPNPLVGTRYHSLVVAEEGLPDTLEVTARSEAGEIMALQHRHLAVTGLQFHPEAVLTEHGFALLRRFLEGETSRTAAAE
ncbi:MAG: aminodeoxychorismate/anthranilate synthase component II [Kiloniellales bacterium]|nr:aminodeoxychorismate/anthranilate synthase component II [Kiloniellales bacterium]